MNKRKTVPKPARPWLRRAALAALIAVAVYANSLGNGFVSDDQQQLLQNPVVSGHQIGAAFGTGVWAFRGVQGNYYRPLQFLVYILLHGLFGFQAFGFHLFFVLLHAANTVLVYLLADRLTARPRVAIAAALLFSVHPIHTEVVDWIASLPDLLMCAAVILGVWLFARQDGSPRGRQVAGHCALYLAALFSKETGVVLLPLYAGFEWIVLGRRWRELRGNASLYGAMAGTLAVYLGARWAALGGLAPAQETFHRLTPPEFALSAVVIAGEYIGRLVWPGSLNYFHVFHATGGITADFLISVAALAVLAIAAFLRATSRAVAFGIFWMAVAIAPALNLTGVGQNVFAERYLYLPSVAFAWIAGMAWDWFATRQLRLTIAAGILIVCAAAWQTVNRNPDWHDDFRLLSVTVRQSPTAGILHNNLAGAYLDRNDLDHALAEERLAVQYEPRSAPFHKNLGLLLMARDPGAAIPDFEEARKLDPADGSLGTLLQEARAARGQSAISAPLDGAAAAGRPVGENPAAGEPGSGHRARREP